MVIYERVMAITDLGL